MLQFVADNADQFKTQYGNVSAASVGAIQRRLFRSKHRARQVLRRTCAGSRGLDPDAKRQRSGEHPRSGQADAVAQGLRDVSAVVAVGAIRESSGNWRSRRSQSWFSSSTKRTCFSLTSRPQCSTRSSRWCDWSDPKASAFTSLARTRSMCRTWCSASSAIECSMRCGRLPRAIRKR